MDIYQFVNISSHKMVFVSLFTSTILIVGIFIYTKIYPKKQISYLILLILFSFLPLISIFRPGVYESGDLRLHTVNLMAFYDSLKSGILIPNWAETLNATYGYPVFQYIYPFPYYLASILHLIGFNFLNSVKLLLGLTYIGSGVFFYLWINNHTKSFYAFCGAIYYLFAPYHLIDMHFRADIGEATALMFLPAALYFIDLYTKKYSPLNLFASSLFVAFLILSHPAISLISFPILLSYSVFVSQKEIKSLLSALKPVFIGLLISAYYWIPALMEGKFTEQVIQVNEKFSYPTLLELLYSKWRLGLLFQGPYGELSFVLGYAHWIIILLVVYLLTRGQIENHYLKFFFLVFLLYLFLILKISSPIWENIETLRKMQFSYRLLSILIFTSSALSAFVLQKIENIKLSMLLVGIVIFSTILNWGNRRTIPEILDKQIKAEMPHAASQYAAVTSAMPIWSVSTIWIKEIPQSHLETLHGNTKIISENRSINSHSYSVDVSEKSILKENTAYYPGWELTVDNKLTNIEYQNQLYPGVITFEVPEGIHEIELDFKETSVRYYSLLISLVSLLICGIYLLFNGIVLKRNEIF